MNKMNAIALNKILPILALIPSMVPDLLSALFKSGYLRSYLNK